MPPRRVRERVTWLTYGAALFTVGAMWEPSPVDRDDGMQTFGTALKGIGFRCFRPAVAAEHTLPSYTGV